MCTGLDSSTHLSRKNGTVEAFSVETRVQLVQETENLYNFSLELH